MNEENTKTLYAKAIIKKNPNTFYHYCVKNPEQVVAYIIDGSIYFFAGDINNYAVQIIDNEKDLINVKQIIELLYKPATETSEKLLVGFCIGSIKYINTTNDPSIVYDAQICEEKVSLVTNELLYVKANSKSGLSFAQKLIEAKFVNYLIAQKNGKIKTEAQLQDTEAKERFYELHLVLNKEKDAIKECIVNEETFLFLKYDCRKNKDGILGSNVGSEIQINELKYNHRVVGFVCLDAIFIEKSYYDRIENKQSWLCNNNCKLKGCISSISSIPNKAACKDEAEPTDEVKLADNAFAETTKDICDTHAKAVSFADPSTTITTPANISAEKLAETNVGRCVIL